MKRCFDIFFSLLALFLLSPLFLLIACAIQLFSPGKILYVHNRIGRGGKIFRCLKFRTMHTGAQKQPAEILRESPSLLKEWKEKQKLASDPRVFPFGRFLRKTSLDELPQLLNVLRGDLSIVGPRPYLEEQAEALGPQAFKILSVKPGITGLWQTSGRNSTTFEERILLDATYVERQSFWFDLTLLLKTIPTLLFPKDAY